MQNKIIFFFKSSSWELFSKDEPLGSLNFWFFLALNSIPNKTIINFSVYFYNCFANTIAGNICDIGLCRRRLDRFTHQQSHASQLTQHSPAGEQGLSRTAPAFAAAASASAAATAVAGKLENEAQKRGLMHAQLKSWNDFDER